MSIENAVTSLEHFFSHCPEMLFIADRDGAILHLSAPLARLLGPEVRAGTKLSERVHPDDRGDFDAAWSRLGSSSERVQLDCRLQQADGGYSPWSWRAQTSPERGDVHGSLREISREAQTLRLLQETLPIVVWQVDRQGVYLHIEGRGLEAMGIKPGQLVGQNLFELFTEESTLEPVRQALAGQHLHTLTTYGDTPREAWYTPFRDGQGRVESVIVISLDVSVAKRAEKELRAQLAVIERQHQVINALSTPIIEVWDKVLTLPIFGVLDSARAARVMETLLDQVSRKGARFAILDLTGVESVDMGTAVHLLKLIGAIRLLGAEGVITGIRPGVAQTMAMMGMDLTQVSTLSTLRAGLQLCIRRMRADTASPALPDL